MSGTDEGDAAHRQKVCEDYDTGRGRKDERGRVDNQESDPPIVVLCSDIKHTQQHSWNQACRDGGCVCLIPRCLHPQGNAL
eukprot:1697164-Rhodomonas_salina.1